MTEPDDDPQARAARHDHDLAAALSRMLEADDLPADRRRLLEAVRWALLGAVTVRAELARIRERDADALAALRNGQGKGKYREAVAALGWDTGPYRYDRVSILAHYVALVRYPSGPAGAPMTAPEALDVIVQTYGFTGRAAARDRLREWRDALRHDPEALRALRGWLGPDPLDFPDPGGRRTEPHRT